MQATAAAVACFFASGPGHFACVQKEWGELKDEQGKVVTVSVPLNDEERRVLLKVRDAGWGALTARDVQLCQQVLRRLAESLKPGH